MTARRVRALRTAFVILSLVTLVAVLLWGLRSPSGAVGEFRVTYLDVGQGDAAWLKTPDGWDILIDGGLQSEGEDVVSYLQANGAANIEVLVLSHPHADHVGGLVTVLENMVVGQVLTNCQDYSSTVYQTFQDLLTATGVLTDCVRAGDTLAWGTHISATVVNPAQPLIPGDSSQVVNNNSVVIRATYGSVAFLFTGDVESEAEAAMLDRGAEVAAQVLKVPHHGSDTSSTEPFLTEVGPELAVISVGASNPYGHPAEQVLQRLTEAGATIYRTDQDGTVVITTDGATWEVHGTYYLHLPLVLNNGLIGGSDVKINPACCQFDAPGDDNANLNEEYVCFTNWGTAAQQMTTWKVQDQAKVAHTYTFPSFTLQPGASVVLHTGSGINTATDLYWGSSAAIWNNDGDTVYLYDGVWNLVDSYWYPGTDASW